jgi:hypothetical protein
MAAATVERISWREDGRSAAEGVLLLNMGVEE